jgi:hypothetical protein
MRIVSYQLFKNLATTRLLATRYQALPGNAEPEALPPLLQRRLFLGKISGSGWEPVKPVKTS